MQDAHPSFTFTGDAVTMRLRTYATRKRMLQQLRTMMGHPGKSHIAKNIQHKLEGDPDPAWAAWG